MKIGDLVKSKYTNENFAKFLPESKIGFVIEVEYMAGVTGAWVEWSGKGIFWSPIQQLEIISKS